MTDRGEGLVRQRLAKLEELRARGLEPYPHRYHRSHTAREAISLLEEAEKTAAATPQDISLAGRVTALRLMGKAAFLDLRDGSGKIQAYFREDKLGSEAYPLLKTLDLGDFLGVRGKLFRTHSGEPTLEVVSFTLLAKALRPLPEKWHGLADVETRYRQRYLDLIANEDTRRLFQVRSASLAAMRNFLNARGFIEVETPILLPIAGGAMARPFVTHHEALDRDLYLRIATELHLKRLIVGGFDKVYEIGRVFRNEGIDTRHNPEFTTLESYEAYADYQDVMRMVEEMFAFIARQVAGSEKITFAGEALDFSPPWQRLTFREALVQGGGLDFEEYPDVVSLAARMKELGVPVEERPSRGRLLDKLLSTFVEPKLRQPTFILDYPVEMSPLAKRKPGASHLVERFEGFAGGMEVANAFTELNDPLDQRQRFEEQERLREVLGDEEAERLDEDFLVALEHGMPPTGGLGVGIDRLVMLLTNQQSIREVILFPQLRTKE